MSREKEVEQKVNDHQQLFQNILSSFPGTGKGSTGSNPCPGLEEKQKQVTFCGGGRKGKANHEEKLEVRKDQLAIRKQDALRQDLTPRRIFDFEGRIPSLL